MRLSRSESKAFRDATNELKDDTQSLAFLRNTAFRIAESHITDHPKLVLRWLERVDKIIDNTRRPHTSAPHLEPTVCFSPGDTCFQLIKQTLNAARIAIDICVFTITDDRVTELLINRHKRGIPIRLISDDDKSLDDGSDIRRLKRAGIPTRIDLTSNHMHHKFAVIDHKHLLTGSYNWTRGATRNHENLLLLHDRPIIKQYEITFKQLWNQFAPPK